MRLFAAALVALIFLACGSPAPETAAAPEPEAPPAAPEEPAVSPREITPMIDPADDQLTAIRADYQRIEAARRAGTLTIDSLSYTCENAMTEGIIYLYTDDSGVVLATHGYNLGDHGGTTEHYYFRDGELVFHFLETGSWQFGGEMKTLSDGTEVPGTIDNVTEERRYYQEGKLIKALTKSYRFENGEDQAGKAAAATNETFSAAGPPPGKALLDAAMATRQVGCGLVRKLIEGS